MVFFIFIKILIEYSVRKQWRPCSDAAFLVNSFFFRKQQQKRTRKHIVVDTQIFFFFGGGGGYQNQITQSGRACAIKIVPNQLYQAVQGLLTQMKLYRSSC